MFSSLVATVVWYLLLQAATSVAALQTTAQDATSAQDATVFSLVYGYPLLSWAELAQSLYEDNGANVLYNAQELISANSASAKDVVSPNQDTLYSSMTFDLTKVSLNITLPDIDADWFHLFSFYDPFGDNWANIGSRNPFNQSGSYLLRRSPGFNSYGVHRDESGTFRAILDAPQALGTLLVRWLVFNDSSLNQIHQWQNKTSVTLVPLPIEEQISGGVGAALAAAKRAPSPAAAVMSMLAEINGYCPALVPSDRMHVEHQLAKAGVRNGIYHKPTEVDLPTANTTVPTISSAQLDAPGNIIDVGHGWTVQRANTTGVFGINYGIREAVAQSIYLQLAQPNAYYPVFNDDKTAGSDISTEFVLGANDSYIFTFSGRPPLSETGFWSLTLYQNHYFVPNPLDRSKLGDRSNLTFADGKLVYHNGGVPTQAPDSEFQILIQPADVTPPRNWTSNWLPGPAGGGSNISVLLRFYDPYDGVVNGTYRCPKITKQSAISG